MLKVVSLLQRKSDISLENFRKWALDEHPELGKKLPGMRHYRMSVVLEDSSEIPYHAISEFWFDDNKGRIAAFATPEGRAAAEDAAAHCDSRVHLLTEEKIIIK